MSFLGVIEVIDRSGHVQQRTRIERLPFRIGRGLGNDLVVDDPHACPQHAEIRAGERLEWVDLGSLNGSYFGARRERRERMVLAGGAELRIGHTQLRFRSADEDLPATLADPLAGSRWLAIDRFGWAGLASAGTLLLMLLEQILASAQALRAASLLSSALPALIVLALWALAWSLVNRVVAHRFHYFGHLAIGGFGVIAGSLCTLIAGYAAYAFAADAWLSAWSSGFAALLAAGVVFGHLRLISRGRARQLLLPSALVGIAFLALALLPGAGENEFSSEPDLSGTLKPPFAALRQGRSSEQFYEDAGSAFDAADEAARKAEESR